MMAARATRQAKVDHPPSSRKAEDEVLSSDSDVPEEESNVKGRRNIKSMDKRRRGAKKSKAKPVSSAQNDLVGSEAEQGDSRPAALNSSEEASTSSLSTPAAASHVLDPSLFAASFSKKRIFEEPGTEESTSALASNLKPTKKRSGLVKGRDGQPMKRLKDGRTIVRVLPKTSTTTQASEEASVEREETMRTPSTLDPSEVLPNARIRAFRKMKLGLREKIGEAKDVGVRKSLRTEEDPLGLEDPAFMKGGELEGVGLSSKKKPVVKPRSVVQLKGRRTKFTPAMSKHGQALQFARSN